MPKGSTKKSHTLAPHLPAGEIIKDMYNKLWQIGDPIGSGGFGLIYLAYPVDNNPFLGNNTSYVVKLEPLSNGPLFCELHFYKRAAKPEMIASWMNDKKLQVLGIPKFISSGQHDHNGIKYRFMVMEQFGMDLQRIFENNGKIFPPYTVFQLGIILLNSLQYIHENGYVHADIKASNLLLSNNVNQSDQVCLVDYGLAFRYVNDGVHKEYKPNPRMKHNGTIEFTSRDAHVGASPSRRGDLEILGYCMLQWMCGRLPWEVNLNDKEFVAAEKHKYMSDVSSLLKKCNSTSHELAEYLKYVAELGYDQPPDYNYCMQLFVSALKNFGHTSGEKLDFRVKHVQRADSKPKPSTPRVLQSSKSNVKKQTVCSTNVSTGNKRSRSKLQCGRNQTKHSSPVQSNRRKQNISQSKKGSSFSRKVTTNEATDVLLDSSLNRQLVKCRRTTTRTDLVNNATQTSPC